MSLKGNVVAAYIERNIAILAVAVNEGTKKEPNTVEYIAEISLDEEIKPATENTPAVIFKDLPAEEQQEELIARIKTKRNQQIVKQKNIEMPSTISL